MSAALDALVVMGVAGCGKSSVGRAAAQALALPFVEGDDFHPPANRDKMARGVPLTDADRAGWLDALAQQLQAHPQPVVLACSALKRSYRDRLRQAAPGLRFAFLDLDRAAVEARLAQRTGHFFAPALIDSQFRTLQPPVGEPRVLRLDATQPVPALCAAIVRWMQGPADAPGEAEAPPVRDG